MARRVQTYFWKKSAFKFKQEFTLDLYDPYIEAMKGEYKEKLVKIGNIQDIARTVSPNLVKSSFKVS